jgi:hypothetical protein
MAKLTFNKNATSKQIAVFLRNTSVTSSVSGLTGVTSAGLNCVYYRSGAVATALTLTSLASVTSTHLTGGFIEVSASGMPGIYRLDLANTMLLTGADFVTVVLKGITNGDEVPLEIELLDAVNVSGGVVESNIVQVSGTVIPAPATAGYLPVTVKVGTGTGEISLTSGRAAADILQWSGVAVLALSAGRVQISVGEYQPNLVPLQPTVSTRTLDVTATGAAGIDWGNVENPTTVLALTQTTLSSTYIPPTSGQNAVQVWATVVSNNTAAGTFGLRMSRFPDVAAGANGGLPLVDASGAVKLSSGTGANQIYLQSGLVTVSGGGATPPTSGEVATQVWATVVANNTAANSFGLRVSRFPDIAAGSVGGVPVLDATAGVPLASGTGANQLYLQSGLVTVSGGGATPPTSGEVATQVWATVIEGSFTAIASMKLQNAAMAGKASGLEVLTPKYRDLSDTLDRITATTTLSGNRTAITYSGL